MIRFNANGKNAKFDSSNPFYANLPMARQTLFKRAFALLPDKNPSPYQEHLTESRRFVQEVLETYACLTGADLSQVVHAVTTGRMDRFASNLHKRIQANIVVSFVKTEKGSIRREEANLAQGHRWKGTLSALEVDDVLKACTEIWASAAGVLTDREKALEGTEGAVHKHDAAERAKHQKYNTSKKNSMAGVEVVNRRQKARQDSVAA